LATFERGGDREVPRPLDGIRVLDITHALNGPCCGVWLSDYGAEVIKVEPRLTGEFGRYIAPIPNCDFSPYFTCANRGKKSITLDITKDKGREVIFKLVEVCDVVINNFRVGVLERLGLGYEALKKYNPKIIYAVSSGYGAKGPMAERPSADFAAQAYGGIISVTGEREQPLPVGASFADLTGTFSLALGVVLALVVRERFGIGQRVDTSLYGGQIMLQTWEIDHYSMLGKLPEPLRAGRFHNLLPKSYGMRKTKDGYVMVAGIAGDVWPLFCEEAGVPELTNDPRFATDEERLKHSDELSCLLDRVFEKKTTKEWLDSLQPLGLRISPIRTYEDIVNDPQAWENGYIIEMDVPSLGSTKLVGAPVMLSETPAEAQGPPPELGQHTEEVLINLGYSWEEVAEMREQEVI